MNKDLIKYWPTKKELKKIDKALKKVINTKGKKALRRYIDRTYHLNS